MNRRFNRFLGMVVTSALAVMSLGGCKDASSDLAPTPELKNLTPNALTWEADDMEPKTIEIEGSDLERGSLTLSGLEDFTAELDGTTLTVAPIWVNDSDNNVINILTVSLKGGKTLTATLTQNKPVRVPELLALTPDALTWAADETEGKTIEVAGEYLTGKVLTVTLAESSNFTVSVEGTTVTVTPKAANTGATAFVETLTVSVDGGNSLEAALTHTAPAPALTALTPDALVWADDETEPKSITFEGTNISGKAITVSELTNFTATVSGTTVTITPKAANTGATAFVETLTVSVEGGNSLSATLTQAAPAPSLTALNPDALTWAAEETNAKTITLEGTNISGKTITLSELTNFDAVVEGTTVTVTPKAANTGNADFVETLTVSVEGGNSLEADLTQTKPVPVITGLTPAALTWASVETNAKTITVEGTYLEGKTITVSELTNFIVTVSETTVTVTPKAANETEADFVETLTVSVEGGNSFEAELKQTKPALVPTLTSLTPAALTWTATETGSKTITVVGENLEGATITAAVEGDAFTAAVEGTTVTVTRATANATYEAVAATLTVSLEGGNYLTATLTQEAKPRPSLTSLTPSALTWSAAETGEKTIAVVGENLEGATITATVEGDAFTATVEGTTVTVTRATANDAYEAVTGTLTVSVQDGNELTATLTQEAKPRPSLTSLTPNALTWAAAETDSKTVTVAGENLEGATITATVDGTAFTVELDGTTVTVTPVAANEGTADVTATLTVSVADGNSLTATLTQTKPALVPTLTSLTPEAVVWAAAETEAKTITVAGEHLENVTLVLSELTNFTATVNGTTITVAPKAVNATYEAVAETLSVSIEGGEPLTATLTQQAKPRPALTSLAPEALTWEAAETGAKTITVAGTNLEGATITATVEGSVFTATVEGTTVTVTPTAVNETDAAVTATLTVAVQDGNSLTATLTQEAKPVPALTSLTPNALTWAATETEAKTIAVAGSYLDGAAISATVEGTAFTATVEGATVTVTPAAANEGDADVTATLTVSVEGGNSLTATLTQTKPESTGGEVATSGWIKVTENKADWSGTYLFVYDRDNTNLRYWNFADGNSNRGFVTVGEDGYINGHYSGKEHTDNQVLSLEDVNNYAVTITQVEGGYALRTATGKYIYNDSGAAQMLYSDDPIVGATSIEIVEDTNLQGEVNKTLKISLSGVNVSFGYFERNNRFRYFPDENWSDKTRITFFEYKE